MVSKRRNLAGQRAERDLMPGQKFHDFNNREHRVKAGLEFRENKTADAVSDQKWHPFDGWLP